jgi:hypothetical protein
MADSSRYLRIYAGPDGESHFHDHDVELAAAEFAPPAPPLLLSAGQTADRLLFATFPAGWRGDWHPTPVRQYFVQLSGELEVEVSDGEVRRLLPGQVVLVEDTTGKGHRTRVIGGADVRCVFVQLEQS